MSFFPLCDRGRKWFIGFGFFWELCTQNQSNALADPYTHGEQNPSQAILHNTRRFSLDSHLYCQHWLILSLYLLLSLRPECNLWAQSWRRVSVLTYASQQTTASSVCATKTTLILPMACCIPPVSVCVCEPACVWYWGRQFIPLGLCWSQVDVFQSTFSRTEQTYASQLRERKASTSSWVTLCGLSVYLSISVYLSFGCSEIRIHKVCGKFSRVNRKSWPKKTLDLPLVLVESEHNDSSDSRLMNQLIGLEWINVATF